MSYLDKFREYFEGKTVLITGGAGFIGSNIAYALHSIGANVRIIDNLITGRMSNIENLIKQGVEFIKADVRDFNACLAAMEGVDYVTHQAALGSVPRSIVEPLLSHDHNVNGTLNVMQAAHIKGVNRVVFASSSSVYGDEASLPKIENLTGRLLSPYAATKSICEVYGNVMNATYGIDIVGLRYFNIYGPRQDPNGQYAAVIPKFISLLLDSKSPVIFGDGEQSRDFTYVDNAINANLSAMSRIEDFGFEVFNIACGDRFTINQLFTKLRDSISHYNPSAMDINVKHQEPRAGDILHSHANIDKAVEQLNYSVIVEPDEGIKKTVDWFMNHLSSLT